MSLLKVPEVPNDLRDKNKTQKSTVRTAKDGAMSDDDMSSSHTTGTTAEQDCDCCSLCAPCTKNFKDRRLVID